MYKQVFDILKNKMIILFVFMYPVLAIIFNYLLKDTPEAVNMVIPIFITMHVIMSPIICMSSIISEEKEKNTLKGLFFASINGREYIIGISSVLMIMLIISMIPYYFILDFTMGQILRFIYFSIIGFACSILLGGVIGVSAKNQMCVGTISSPISMLIGLLPMAAIFNDTIDKCSRILYSKRIYDVVYRFMRNNSIDYKTDTVVCLCNMFVLSIIFGFFYKKSRKLNK